jgi:hypothetical protein
MIKYKRSNPEEFWNGYRKIVFFLKYFEGLMKRDFQTRKRRERKIGQSKN